VPIHPLAGKPASPDRLVDVDRLRGEFYDRTPDLGDRSQRVAFGTSGHRGTSLAGTFNAAHVVAITQAICDYRRQAGTNGPLFIGKDTHALSQPAFETSLEVLAAHAVEVLIDSADYTPTPVVSHAILTHNRGRTTGLTLQVATRRARSRLVDAADTCERRMRVARRARCASSEHPVRRGKLT